MRYAFRFVPVVLLLVFPAQAFPAEAPRMMDDAGGIGSWSGEAGLVRLLETGLAEALTLVSGDFDSDGVPDLVSAYATPAGGALSLHRGNIDAIHPNAPEAWRRRIDDAFTEVAFLEDIRVFKAPVLPVHLEAGDFDADGHLDLVAAAERGRGLYFLPGDGNGGFGPAERLSLGGPLTALAAADVNRRDNLNDLIVGVGETEKTGAQVLVFKGATGAFRSVPEPFDLAAEATDFAVTRLNDGDAWYDLAVASGNRLVHIAGRDPETTIARTEQHFQHPITSLAAGDFTGSPGSDYALTTADGMLHVLDPVAQTHQTTMLPVSATSEQELIAARSTGTGKHDLVVMDAPNRRLHVYTRTHFEPNLSSEANLEALSLPVPDLAPLTLDLDAEPVAVAPMRLNGDALDDWAVLNRHPADPLAGGPLTVVRSEAQGVFIVNLIGTNRDASPGDGVCTIPDPGNPGGTLPFCTLDAALEEANSSPSMDLIIFNLPGTGVQTLKPASFGVDQPVTIDGTTQQTAEGLPLIEIRDTPMFIQGSNITLKGLAINGTSFISMTSFASSNIIEGNFIGINASGVGLVDPDPFQRARALIDLQGGNNVIGGTTEESTNYIAGAREENITLFGTSATSNMIQGNIIGTDRDGTVDLPNAAFGISVQSGAFDNEILGNLIVNHRQTDATVGTFGHGIRIIGSLFSPNDRPQGNLIQGNDIGSDGLGFSRPNYNGIFVGTAVGNTIGGTSPGHGNLIGTNENSGVRIVGDFVPPGFPEADTRDNEVFGNLIFDNGEVGVALLGAKFNKVGERPSQNAPVQAGKTAMALTCTGACNEIVGNGTRLEIDRDAGILIAPFEIPVPPGFPVPTVPASENTVEGNFIGTTDGIIRDGNKGAGILILNASENQIGGPSVESANLISGNRHGIRIAGLDAELNVVEGNRIGTNAAGTDTLGNTSHGVKIEEGAHDNRIGGTDLTTPGGSCTGACNLISGNGLVGIDIGGVSDAPMNNLMQGNYIGTDLTGLQAVPNGRGGIDISDGDQTIGGTTPGVRNVISGNNDTGLTISGVDGGTIQGNFIGINAAGADTLENEGDGIQIFVSTLLQIGGTDPGAGNVISGNEFYGITLDNESTGNFIQGNLIGTDSIGIKALGNGFGGMIIEGGSNNNTIGGTSIEAANFISGNKGDGILIEGFSDDKPFDNLIQGNFIGVDKFGTQKLSNTGDGISIQGEATNNFIGGNVPNSGNIISGNMGHGIRIGSDNDPAPDNRVLRNFIGIDFSGLFALGNGKTGVFIDHASGTLVGDTPGTGNTISGNDSSGVRITGATATGNVLKDNFIGIGTDGLTALGNARGITIVDAPLNAIGGAGTRNVISGNRAEGILLLGEDASDTHIVGNYIGTDADGTDAVENNLSGISLINVPSTLIGGATPEERNVISGNGLSGIEISGEAATENIIAGNFIGTDVTGTDTLGNGLSGIRIEEAPANQIGAPNGASALGPCTGACNLISANGFQAILPANGVIILGEKAQGNVVFSNYIGTDVTGTKLLGNAGSGVGLIGAPENVVGGLLPQQFNLISGNEGSGVEMGGAHADRNIVAGNLIGTQIDRQTANGNFQNGILITNGADGNSILENEIGFNGGFGTSAGVRVRDTDNSTHDNEIRGNQIFLNSGLGIDLGSTGVTPNDDGDSDDGANRQQNYPVIQSAVSDGTNVTLDITLNSQASTDYSIEIFANNSPDPSGFGEGDLFLGSVVVTTNTDGDASTTPSFPVAQLPVGTWVTTTATLFDPVLDEGFDTSEFSAAVQVIGVGVDSVYANVRVFLEGAYTSDGDTMRTDLVDLTAPPGDLFPATQPYNQAPFANTPLAYTGVETLSGDPPETVVDWVLLELRTDTTGASTVARRAGLLHTDGRITDLDGTSKVCFIVLDSDVPYRIVVRHRNHLAVMSDEARVLPAADGPAGPPYDVNFTTDITLAHPGTTTSTALVEVVPDIFGLWTGNAALGDGTERERIDTDDDAVWQTQFGMGAQGYLLQADYTLNGRVQPDDHALWLKNQGTVSTVPEQ